MRAFSSLAIAPAPESPTAADALAAVESALAAVLRESDSGSLKQKFLAARRSAAAAIAGFSRRETGGPLVATALRLIREISDGGLSDLPAEAEDLALADALGRSGWTGLLAAMLLVPSWQWPGAPALEKIPDWLWGDGASWIFFRPQSFATGSDRKLYAARIVLRQEELETWAGRNRGSSAVRAAIEAYALRGRPAIEAGDLQARRCAELHGRLLGHLARRAGDSFDRPAYPSEGRRLKVGFVSDHFVPPTGGSPRLPAFGYLDPEQFEAVCFDLQTLPASLEEQIAVLREANLDIAVIGIDHDVTFKDPVTRLALHRVAPLQAAWNPAAFTTGLPEIDLFVSPGQANGAKRFTERLGLLYSSSEIPPETVADPLASSDALGELLLFAYAELADKGWKDFRADRAPLSAPAGFVPVEESLESGASALAAGDTDAALAHARTVLRAAPADPAARYLAGRAFLSAGKFARALDYLVAAAQSAPDPAVQFDLARTLRKLGEIPLALEALETSLRLDPTRAPAWLMLAELSGAIGSKDLAREALVMARGSGAPEVQVAELEARLAAA